MQSVAWKTRALQEERLWPGIGVGCPSKGVESPSLEVLQKCLDVALGDCGGAGLMVGLKVSSNLDHSVKGKGRHTSFC